jgi:hypothetical protein
MGVGLLLGWLGLFVSRDPVIGLAGAAFLMLAAIWSIASTLRERKEQLSFGLLRASNQEESYA